MSLLTALHTKLKCACGTNVQHEMPIRCTWCKRKHPDEWGWHGLWDLLPPNEARSLRPMTSERALTTLCSLKIQHARNGTIIIRLIQQANTLD